MSFHEKSAWACVVSIGLVYVPYFVMVFRYPMAALGLIWVSAFGLAALLSVFHIANAIATRSIRTTGNVPPIDELDRRVELNAAKWAGLTLAFAVFTWILVAMYTIPVIGGRAGAIQFAVPVFTAMTAVHWLFAGFVLSNVTYYGGIAIGYRRLHRA